MQQRYPHYWADLSGGLDAILARMSSKARATLKRKERRFAERSGGQVEIRSYRTPGELDAFHALARAVSAKTHQERLLGAGLPDRESFRQQARQLAARGQVFGFLLFLDGMPIAYLYCPVEQDSIIYGYVGHLEEYGDLSPGTILLMGALRSMAEARVARWFDFTAGDGQHKRQFATGSAECVDVAVLDATLANRWLVASQRMFHELVEGARGWAERSGRAAQLRRALKGS